MLLKLSVEILQAVARQVRSTEDKTPSQPERLIEIGDGEKRLEAPIRSFNLSLRDCYADSVRTSCSQC
jgi:hypothetical protein